ncbi:MAG TPA: sulfite reductase subunit alpha, partial [Xanthobacteraceae bacterium]|nr:sulfite reductase subunit alpha [Xanthobacteraceae bacterium]
MTQNLPPPTPSLLPETAPFTPEQRAWLNGFFSGYLGIGSNGVVALSPEENAALLGGMTAKAPEDDGEAPWHDQTIPLDERMKLAEGRPLPRRMMAAMAQQDCGQCGYNCSDYSGLIASRKEARLNLCVPGGKETARMLKKLYEEIDAAPAAAVATVAAAPAAEVLVDAAPGTSRDNPSEARFLSRTRLNKKGSNKETWHVELDLSDSGIEYAVGDAFGLYPRNDPALVEEMLRVIGAPPDHPIGKRTLREALTTGVSLAPAPDTLFQFISYITGGERRQKAKQLATGEDPDGDAANLDVLAALQKFPGIKVDPEALIESLDPMQPRLYSISSSLKVQPKTVTLTVDAVRYAIKGRNRLGVASTFLADRVSPGDTLKAYVQKAHHFSLPPDLSTPVIMVGPGTGVAPFRAFLQERMATGATGRNWLFFGHQRRDTDFFYENEFVDLKTKNVLTRLSLAWSRDTEEKFYVQDRMRQVGADLWSWLAEGAHFYVCGDAKRMEK